MPKKDVSTRSSIETITPLTAPTIKPKGADTDNLNRKHRIIVFALIGSLVLLVVSGGWLLYFLSKNPLPTGETTAIPSPAPVDVKKRPAKSPEEQPMPTVDPEQIARQKETAEQKLADFLEARNNLEGKGVADWGESSYIEMIKISEAADADFMNKEYIILNTKNFYGSTVRFVYNKKP